MSAAVPPAAAPSPDWRAASQQRLEAALEELLARLGAPETAAPAAGGGGALDSLVASFGLSAFERDLLLLAAGHELDGRFRSLLQGPPTFARAARLAGGHWSALMPDGPLRRGRLVRLEESGEGLVHRPIRIEETVLLELLGLPHLDEALRPLLDPLPPEAAERLLPSQEPAARQLAALWSESSGAERAGIWPVVWLGAAEGRPEARALVAAAGRELGLTPFALAAGRLPEDPQRLEDLAERWRRDAVLQSFLLLVELEDDAPWATRQALRQWLEHSAGPAALLAEAPPDGLERPLLRLELPPPAAAEAAHLWRGALGPLADSLSGSGAGADTVLERVARQFPLPPRAIHEVALELAGNPPPAAELEVELWRRARRRARGGLDRLAQRLEPVAGWDDLILPPAQMEILHAIAAQVRQRSKVYETWGFADTNRRGLGLAALFSGPSGAGKTLAGEVLARELELDLYRIDPSAVVSKYIGDTERNLRRLFDAAERSGAILLFDEADSLFGKRSEVRDSHDRYANLEVSYLLQRIEAYRGLAILTSNFEKSLDSAFLRRLRFVVPFPFPASGERRRIWERAFPPPAPTLALDFPRLSQLAVTGGSIRNIALAAAFRAADAGRAISMADLQAAARGELLKLSQPLPENELRGWVS